MRAAIDVSESFTTSVDNEPKQSALRFNISRRKSKEVLNLPLEERLEGIIRPADDPEKFNGSCSPGLYFSIPEVVVNEDIDFLFKESACSVVDCNVGKDECFKQLIHVLLEEGLHFWPVHQALEEFQAVEHNRVVLLVLRGAGTERPNLKAKVTNGLLHVLLVLVGIEKNGLEGSSLALEDIFIVIGQLHDFLEHAHPMLQVVLILRVQILVIEVVEQLHEDLEDGGFFARIGVANDRLKYVGGQIFEKIVHLVTNLDDLFVKRVASGQISVFVREVFEDLEDCADGSRVLRGVVNEIDCQVVPVGGEEHVDEGYDSWPESFGYLKREIEVGDEDLFFDILDDSGIEIPLKLFDPLNSRLLTLKNSHQSLSSMAARNLPSGGTDWVFMYCRRAMG